MKVDYQKFPEIPEGCQLNYNKTRDVYQVFRETREIDPSTGKKKNKRETLGQIKNGVFSFSKLYLARQQNKILSQELKTRKAIPVYAHQSVSEISQAIQESEMEQRDCRRITFPLEPIVQAAIMCALSGVSDCEAISQYYNDNFEYFSRCHEDLPQQPLTADIVYRAFLKVEPEKFEEFYRKMLFHLLDKASQGMRIISADGQGVRATSGDRCADSRRNDCYMLMNFYDVQRKLCLKQRLISKKNNKITVGPEMLSTMDVAGAVITADAMSCQLSFVETVLKRSANYCVSLKGNQEKSWNEVRRLFVDTHPDQILKLELPVELVHGRIESRTYSIIRGSLLSKVLREKWDGLQDGCVVKVSSGTVIKNTGQESFEDRYYITSLPYNKTTVEDIAKVIRSHWAVENNLHWVLDVNFLQDRIQGKDEAYISNRVGLNKLALAMIENYRFWLWDTNRVKGQMMPVKATQQRCRKPELAMECLACSQGFL